jgi:hypothetical protein
MLLRTGEFTQCSRSQIGTWRPKSLADRREKKTRTDRPPLALWLKKIYVWARTSFELEMGSPAKADIACEAIAKTVWAISFFINSFSSQSMDN